MKSVFESVGGTYTQSGDYFIPDIALPKTSNRKIGKYGRMRHRYLKEHRPVLYTNMILDGTLWDHLAEVDIACNNRLDVLISGMQKNQGITEVLKSRNPMAWVDAMNNIRKCAEEIILRELVYEEDGVRIFWKNFGTVILNRPILMQMRVRTIKKHSALLHEMKKTASHYDG